jgi:hypothetical protein
VQRWAASCAAPAISKNQIGGALSESKGLTPRAAETNIRAQRASISLPDAAGAWSSPPRPLLT